MAAQTQDVVRVAYSTPESAPNELHIQLDNTTIYQGSVAIAVAGLPVPARPAWPDPPCWAWRCSDTRPPTPARTRPMRRTRRWSSNAACFFREQRGRPVRRDVHRQGRLSGGQPDVQKTLAANDVSGILRFIQDGQLAVEI